MRTGLRPIIPRMDTVMALGKEKGPTRLKRTTIMERTTRLERTTFEANDASGLPVPVDPALDERPSSRPNSTGSDDESSAPEDDSASSYHASSPILKIPKRRTNHPRPAKMTMTSSRAGRQCMIRIFRPARPRSSPRPTRRTRARSARFPALRTLCPALTRCRAARAAARKPAGVPNLARRSRPLTLHIGRRPAPRPRHRTRCTRTRRPCRLKTRKMAE
ncbi:hypothetical protein DFH11DRAFT_1628130 [Phellopilus nigrolimitatus]|nr:hypothetical protein DFH11DRAFT_1628130 [Phellopilus nigrolimitatus]